MFPGQFNSPWTDDLDDRRFEGGRGLTFLGLANRSGDAGGSTGEKLFEALEDFKWRQGHDEVKCLGDLVKYA
jgi:hypothetical protein